jgi:hypothetical protein
MAMMKGIWVLEKRGKFTTKTTKKAQRSQRVFMGSRLEPVL